MSDFLYFYPQDVEYPLDSDCTNCGKRTELVWLYEWGFWACQECAEECDLTSKAEATCPDLYEEVISAKSIQEIQQLMKSHSCEKCRKEWRKAA
jgi:hypothetical protein